MKHTVGKIQQLTEFTPGNEVALATVEREWQRKLDALQRKYDGAVNTLKDMREALAELSAMYTHAWDTDSGNLLMLAGSVERFEKAHAKAKKALEKASD